MTDKPGNKNLCRCKIYDSQRVSPDCRQYVVKVTRHFAHTTENEMRQSAVDYLKRYLGYEKNDQQISISVFNTKWGLDGISPFDLLVYCSVVEKPSIGIADGIKFKPDCTLLGFFSYDPGCPTMHQFDEFIEFTEPVAAMEISNGLFKYKSHFIEIKMIDGVETDVPGVEFEIVSPMNEPPKFVGFVIRAIPNHRIILKHLLAEIKLLNDGATTDDEYMIGVGQLCTEVDEILKGKKEMPAAWFDIPESFREQTGRDAVAGVDFDPEKSMCRDDYEFFTGTGRYSGNKTKEAK